MSRRNMKNFTTYREGPFKGENEPEEGEIVDDYDLIVSSDEELCMRQRIRELEAENEEIEQIAVISRSFVDKINHPHYNLENSRAAQVPTDVSSISSTEFVTPKKRKRRKSREHKRKHCHRQHQHEHNHQYEQYLRYDVQQIPPKTRIKKSHCKRRQKMIAKKHKRLYSDRVTHKDIQAETVSLESPESSESSSLTDSDTRLSLKRKESISNEKYITRDTLRLAVARNTNESAFPLKKSCLKDKLQRQELAAINERNFFLERIDIRDDNNDDDDDDDVQVIENEPDIQIVDEDSTDSMEEKELRLIALKSAVLKKHFARKMRNAEAAYSPTDFDEMLSSGLLHQDNKLDDIDVDIEAEDSQTACVTISPEASPQLVMLDDQDESLQMVDCKPVDMDIANSDSEGATIDSWSKDVEPSFPKYSLESHDFSNKIQYRFYMEDLHELPPPPPGVDDYDNVPPPPPYHILYNAESLDMDLNNEVFSEVQHRLAEKVKEALEDNQTDTDKNIFLPPVERSKEQGSEDEEEEALRALLLSKFQSPKNQKKIKRPNGNSLRQDTSNKIDMGEQDNYKPKPTEFILKEAVKRLKIHSQTEVCKEDVSIPVCNKIDLNTENPIQEYHENSSASLGVFKKLTNHLDKYKNPHQINSTDQNKSDSDQDLFEEKEVKETYSNSNNNVCNQHTISNSSEVTSKIDISDITRRLQKIKENVLLNLTNNSSPKVPPTNLNPIPQAVGSSKSPNDSFKVTKQFSESNQSSVENGFVLNKPLTNNLVNIVSANNDLDTAVTKNKTVKANYDIATKQTSFKVTIKNSESFESEGNNTTNTFNDVTYKENNTNNVTIKLPWKTNENTRSKVAVSTEKIVKATNSTAESKGTNNAHVIKSSSFTKQIVNDIKANPTPTYSFTRTAKIVKPNKVINANIDLNLRQLSQATESTSVLKQSLPETKDQLPKVADNSRLITSIDQVKHMCTVAPFVISIQNYSNESSDEEWCKEYDSLYKPLYDYNDNASPLSLNLESPSRTPLRSNSPTEPGADGSTTKHSALEAFNLKTKNTYLHTENLIDKTPQTSLAVQSEKIKKTPLAVRHLPAAAQNEYRRLVHRMKLLENKRKLAEITENKNESKTITKNCTSLPVTEESCIEKEKSESMNSLLKSSLVKKVLLRNASNNNSTSSTSIAAVDTSNSSSKLHKGNVLRSYENLYVKFGAGIVNNLDKSLKLVEDAKKAKIEKLKLENRLKELKAEMDILQAKHKEEQLKISRIYPSICTTNEVITSLKQKRSKVFKAAVNLGKSIKGEVYRLNNDLKETITTKSKKLATEIKIVNSLKVQDITNMEVIINSNTSEEQPENKNENEKIEDSKKEFNGENVEVKLNPNTAATNTMDCSERNGKEEEEKGKEENNLESPLKPELGGNTEFQSLEPNISKSIEDRCPLNKETPGDIADSEKCSKQSLSLYISPLEHLRNIDSNMDPNGVVCPYDLMGNCEDATCKYVHITSKVKT